MSKRKSLSPQAATLGARRKRVVKRSFSFMGAVCALCRGACGIPASAMAVSVNVTVVHPAAAGHLRFYPGDASLLLASMINFAAGWAYRGEL